MISEKKKKSNQKNKHMHVKVKKNVPAKAQSRNPSPEWMLVKERPVANNENVKNSVKSGNSKKGQVVQAKKKVKKQKPPLTEEQKLKRKKRRLFILIFVLIIMVIQIVLFATSLHKWHKIIKEVTNTENSVVLDASGNVLAVLGESRIQETVGLNEIPQDLIDAYVSIEDKNFYKHHGVNVKRTIGAIGSYVLHRGSASYGGSTITQQLVKNVTGENASSISRKVTEWDRAIKTEMVLSKDEIMQTYLNIIYVGPNVYGVKMGAKYYFDKDVSDLSLAECAFLAGLNHSPNSYNPFGDKDNSDRIKSRSEIVLNVMLAQKYITNDEYNNALEEIENGLKFKHGEVESDGNRHLFIYG